MKKRHVPLLLIWSRLLLSLVLVVLALSIGSDFSWLSVTLVSIGLLTDIFDGIIARRLGVSDMQLRRLDSIVDQVFWIAVAAAACIRYPLFFKEQRYPVSLLIGAELLAYLVCYIRFRKEVATHAISSKIWTLILFATLLQTLATGSSHLLFNICIVTGLITRAEIILILLVIRKWTNDVPSVFHAFRLRKGKEIRRHKLFNG